MGAKHSMPKGYSKKQIKEFQEIFKKYDSDGNGKLDQKEMTVYLNEIGFPPFQHKMLLYIADHNQNGSIDFNEFIKFINAINNIQTPDDLTRLAFDSIDVDKSGSISKAELVHFYDFMGFSKVNMPDLENFNYNDFSLLVDIDN